MDSEEIIQSNNSVQQISIKRAGDFKKKEEKPLTSYQPPFVGAPAGVGSSSRRWAPAEQALERCPPSGGARNINPYG